MTRADFLIDMILKGSPALGRAIEAFFLLIGCLVMAVIAYSTWKPMMAAYAANEFFGVQGIFTIKTWPLRAVIIAGSLLTALVFLVQAVQEAAQIGKPAAAGAR